MPRIEMEVPHHLPQPEALARIRSFLGALKTQYSGQIGKLEEEWTGNAGKFSFTAMGFPVSGGLLVKPDAVSLSGELPLAASFAKGQIERTIRERLQALLA